MVIAGAGIPPVSISLATSITWLLDQRSLKADKRHLFFLILFNEGETKEDKEYGKQNQLKGGSQASNEEASKPSQLFSENNPKAAKPLADKSTDINHGWDATVCTLVHQPI